MWRKLLLYMLALVLAVGVFVSCGLFFAGQFSTTTEKYSDNLTFQNEFYTRQIEKYFDDLSMADHRLRSGTTGNASAGLSLDILVYDFGRNRARANAQVERVVSAEYALVSEGYAVFEEVSEAYFTLMARDALLEVAQTNAAECAHKAVSRRRLDAKSPAIGDAAKPYSHSLQPFCHVVHLTPYYIYSLVHYIYSLVYSHI